MDDSKNNKSDIIDEDLYEEIDDEEILELLEQEKRRSSHNDDKQQTKRQRFPKWAFWLIAIAMLLNVVAIIPQTYSIPAIDFLVTSAKLSTNPAIDEYQDSVVVIEAGNSKGTGFSITADGIILTNHHVIEGEKNILVAFPEEGLFDAEVIQEYPEIDLAVLQVDGMDLPSLTLANETIFKDRESIYFIGNPLKFRGIANEGEVIGYTELENWDKQVMMLDAPVYRGNSGSPVINMEGEVIGVVFATLNHDVNGKVGLAVPIDYYYDVQK